MVRSFRWAARVLAVPCPDLYVVDEVPGIFLAGDWVGHEGMLLAPQHFQQQRQFRRS